MICSKNCTCLLCRELQSCQPKSAKMKKSDKGSDNFILRKAEAFKNGGPLGFIRGAARMSVRNWQNKEPKGKEHGTQPPRVSRAASCEQIFPMKMNPDSKMYRAPSVEHITKSRANEKPFLRLITESKFVGKSQNSDLYSGKESAKGVLKFRKTNDATYTKNTHEKYIPLPIYEPKYSGKVYVDQNYGERASPLYQEINKKTEKSSRASTVRVTQPKKQTTDLAACFQELSSKKGDRKANEHPSIGAVKMAEKQNHKVVIYFGDSMARNQFEKKEDTYAKSLLNDTSNLDVTKTQKTSGTAELISQISIDDEPIYSEITDVEGRNREEVGNIIATEIEDGVINVEFKENFECARKWVDIINGSAVRVDDAPEAANESLDWSFVQGWRKR
jgi:hypothetical protein